MMTLRIAPTPHLSQAFLADLRNLLDLAFDGRFTDDDWRHAIGGLHVWLVGGDRPISHASLVDRTLVCSGETLNVGYVEAVATAPAWRRRGHGAAVMRRVGELIRERYPLGVLSTGLHAFYEAHGWERWRGPTFAKTTEGHERTPDDDGGVMILRAPHSPRLDLDGAIVCEWRPGDVW
jgi:aminoglycoside 2'-N-acetyltransferase I